MRYNPHQHAARLGIQVEYVPALPWRGRWLPDKGIIELRQGMRWHDERSTLTHELAHAILGHIETTPKNERAADRWAAHKLIDPDELRRVTALSDDPAQWCLDLETAPRHLRIYQETQCSTLSQP